MANQFFINLTYFNLEIIQPNLLKYSYNEMNLSSIYTRVH